MRVVLNTLVSEIAAGAVFSKEGDRFQGRTIVWAGGVRPNPLLDGLDLPKAKDGRLVVDRMFRVGGRPDVLALFAGLPAWAIWRLNYLTQLLGVRNRSTLILEWILSLLFSRMAANTP